LFVFPTLFSYDW